MTTDPQTNRTAIRRIPLEVFNQGRLELLDELVAPDYIEHAPFAGLPPGLAGLKAFVNNLRAAFPDFYYSLVDELAEGDTFVVRLRAHGTHDGPLPLAGQAPTGRYAEWEELHVARMRDGKLAEHWVVADQLGLLRQLGLLPAAASAQ